MIIMLSLNFHQTFIPERQLIAALLEYAALGKEGSLPEISKSTGIPMGESSGKMPAMLHYCVGMGLLEMKPGKTKGRKKLSLTPFGQVVFSNDKFLGEPLTQWLVHLNLCRGDIGAKLWNKVFADSTNVLGDTFTRNQLQDYLVSYFGKGRRIGPLISTYTNDAALGRSKALVVKEDSILRNKCPVLSTWTVAYSAFMLELLEAFFQEQTQVTVTDFAKETHWFDICGWKEADIQTVFSQIEIKGFISIDRQIRPWIIEKRASARNVWPLIFNEH